MGNMEQGSFEVASLSIIDQKAPSKQLFVFRMTDASTKKTVDLGFDTEDDMKAWRTQIESATAAAIEAGKNQYVLLS